MTRLVNPIPPWFDARGALLDGGYIYVGNPSTDPTVVANQLPLFWDLARTLPAVQPLRTVGGVIVNGLNVARVYFASADFAITVKDANSNLVWSVPSAFDLGAASYQPLATNLTTIAGLAALTSIGQGILTAANAAAAQALLGLGTSAPLNIATAAQYRANTPSLVITTDQAWGAALYVGLTPGATVNLDLSTGINFSLAMGGNYTLANFTNGKEGQNGKIWLPQDATGNRTLSYGSAYKPLGGTAPVLSTAANARDILYYEVLPGAATAMISLVKNVAP